MHTAQYMYCLMPLQVIVATTPQVIDSLSPGVSTDPCWSSLPRSLACRPSGIFVLLSASTEVIKQMVLQRNSRQTVCWQSEWISYASTFHGNTTIISYKTWVPSHNVVNTVPAEVFLCQGHLYFKELHYLSCNYSATLTQFVLADHSANSNLH